VTELDRSDRHVHLVDKTGVDELTNRRRSAADTDVWVPRTVSRILTSAFAVAQVRRPPAIADQHDRSLWPSDSPTSRSDAC